MSLNVRYFRVGYFVGQVLDISDVISIKLIPLMTVTSFTSLMSVTQWFVQSSIEFSTVLGGEEEPGS
jgi:hypothetical protein